MTATLPAAGRYKVRVDAYDGGTGPYSLAIRSAPAAPLAVETPRSVVVDDRTGASRLQVRPAAAREIALDTHAAGMLSNETPVGLWTFEGTRGQVASVAVASGAFDPIVEVRSPTGERLWSDYDSGPGRDASLTEVLPVSGRFEVRVRAVGDGRGSYRLAVRTVAKAHLAVDTPVAGALDEKAPAGAWTFDATAGQVVSVAAASEAFDPEVELRLSTGKRLASDDDSGPGTNASLTETLPATGRYLVRVRAVDGATGAYRLTVSSVPEALLNVHAPVAGVLDDRTRVGVWGFDGVAGQILDVTARSDAFPPTVELRSPTGKRVRRLESGDISSDAWLRATLPADGLYRVRVRTVDGDTSPYHLTARTSAPHELALDTHVTAELGEGRPVGVWGFTGVGGQAVSVAVDSERFTPTFEVWTSSGDRVPWHDKPPTGTGRWTTLPADGRYEVRIRARGGGTGPYRVAVRTGSVVDTTEPATVARLTAPSVSDADIARLADGHRMFAFDLSQALRSTTGNLIYSPYSLSLSFGMLAAGARGETVRQIAETFHFLEPSGVLHPAFNALDLALRADAGNRTADAVATGRAYRLAVTNALWSQTGSSILPAFRDVLAHHYGARLEDIDFRDNPNRARRRINDWVREQTAGQVRELLADGAIRRDTALVLANAVAFEARWQDSFLELDTENRPFQLLGGVRSKRSPCVVTSRSATRRTTAIRSSTCRTRAGRQP